MKTRRVSMLTEKLWKEKRKWRLLVGDDRTKMFPKANQKTKSGPTRLSQWLAWFVQIYSGTLQLFDSRNLDPATKYLFRVCAVNSAGASEWSPIAEASTMAAPPAVVTGLQLRLATANALSMIWQRPLSNGENITHFNVDTGSSVVLTPGKKYF